MMKVLVTGSVKWADPAPIERRLQQLATTSNIMVLTGMADGADAIARSWAIDNGVPVLAEPLDAGDYPIPMHRYNERMLAWQPDLVLAYKTNFDPVANVDAGTEHMCRIATAAGIPVELSTAAAR